MSSTLHPAGRPLARGVEWEFDRITFDRDLSRALIAQVLIERAEHGGWELDRVRIGSAGVRARSGDVLAEHAADLLGERGIDSDGFRSRPLTAELIAGADLVLAANREHKSAVIALDPTAGRRAFTIREFGWLLGDDGSGYWIGRRVVRAAVGAIDGRLPETALADALLGIFLGTLAVVGFFVVPISPLFRIVYAVLAALVLLPTAAFNGNNTVSIIAAVIGLCAIGYEIMRGRTASRAAISS